MNSTAAIHSQPVDPGILKRRLTRATRRARMTAFLLALPLLAFITLSFALPIGSMLLRSIHNPTFPDTLPRVAASIEDWTGPPHLPDEATFRALVVDLAEARAARTVGRAATRLNYDLPGARSMITSASRKAVELDLETDGPFRDTVIGWHKNWGDPAVWASIRRVLNPYSPGFYLAAIDLKYDEQERIIRQAEERRIYVTLFVRTLWLSSLITAICLLLGFPVAYLLANLPLRYSNLLMICVLLPFWTSLLVRTTAWIVLLQSQGVINDILVFLGLAGDENRAQMIYNATGTVVAMTHILLPFMILPLYSVMRTISTASVRAARSLGANSLTAFTRIYLPQTLPGIGAGCLLVFILAIGYYITPALVGGQSGQLISNIIAFHLQKSLNWSLGAALGTLLLLGVLGLYYTYNRIVGIENMKLG